MSVKMVYINPGALLDALTSSRISVDIAVRELIDIANPKNLRVAAKIQGTFFNFLQGRLDKKAASTKLCTLSCMCRPIREIADDLADGYREVSCVPDEVRPWRVTWVGAGNKPEAVETS